MVIEKSNYSFTGNIKEVAIPERMPGKRLESACVVNEMKPLANDLVCQKEATGHLLLVLATMTLLSWTMIPLPIVGEAVILQCTLLLHRQFVPTTIRDVFLIMHRLLEHRHNRTPTHHQLCHHLLLGN